MGYPAKEMIDWDTRISLSHPSKRMRRMGHPNYRGAESGQRNSLTLHVGVFLIALEDVGLGDYAFEQAGDGAVDDGQDGPAVEVGQGFVERQIGIQERRAIVGQQLFNWLVGGMEACTSLGKSAAGRTYQRLREQRMRATSSFSS